jgi:opacity protein-like surface antigen
MRRMLLVVAAIVGMAATAEAQWNQPPAPQAQPQATNMYGWNKHWMWWKKDSSCGSGGCGSRCGAGGGGAGAGGGQPQGGTLVFPMNPYVRSPRDFFMWEPGK